MDELRGFCVRMLGDSETARAAEQAARAAGHGDRLGSLAAAAAACREGEGTSPSPPTTSAPPSPAPDGLAETVARELNQAVAELPERQREALALRELLGLTYDEMAEVIGLEAAAVAPLLARSRLRLRTALRGDGEPPGECAERERALRTMALRQDGQTVTPADDDWLIEHLRHCAGCGRTHAAMLEASACYRAWRAEDER
jgi:RNA polymerase sigma factor (sigma-70 family)